MRTVALLPMKAHSERIPGKNFREFAGKPLFRWMLDRLLAIDEIDLVVINTDGRQLLEHHGLRESKRVMIRDRREEICGDFVSMNIVLADDVENVDADNYLMTHTTNPLLSIETIRHSIENFMTAMRARRCDSLFTVNRVQTRFYKSDGTAVNHDPNKLVRTQDLEPWFEENSNLYLFTRDSFRATKSRIGERPLMLETDKLESLDIDTPRDWGLAVLAAKYLYP